MTVADIITALKPLEVEGGRRWYDELDNALRDQEIFQAISKIVDREWPRAVVVTSGQFGHEFQRWARYAQPSRKVVVVRGGLRYDPAVKIDPWDLRGRQHIVFVDDTLFAGRTRRAVEGAVNREFRELSGTVVAFASPQAEPYPNTFALYYGGADGRAL
jgi:hypothetical protein